MQVKKFEAPTMQEALEAIKRELGPEAIILQTKNHKRGFGLLSKPSVEVTAAVSDRSLHRKQFADVRMPESSQKAVKELSADRQADVYEKYLDKHLEKAGSTRDRVDVSRKGGIRPPRAAGAAPVAKRMTATRYAEIDVPPAAAAELPAPARRVPILPVVTEAVAAPPQAAGATAAGFDHQGMGLEDEVRLLKRMIEEIKLGGTSDSEPASGAQALLAKSKIGTPALHEAFEQLVIAGIDKRYAYSLIKSVAFELGVEAAQAPEQVLDQLAIELMRNTEIISPLGEPDGAKREGPRIVALVGPTGVGKTTTVAKMASEALLKRGLKVGLINLDSYKVAAFDQLGTYAKILNVPFRSAGTVEDLRAALSDFHTLDLVLVDTTGRSQRDPGSLREMQQVMESVSGMNTHLVLSVTTRDAELYDMATRFSIFKPQGIIVSKLDEATLYGAIYNVSQKVKLPLLYFTTGQRVPEDIEEATRERVAALILDL